MLRPRHRAWRVWLWMERLQHKGSCKHQIPAGFLFLAYFKAFKVWSQGEDPQGTLGLCPHIEHPQPRGGWARPKDSSSFCHGPFQKVQPTSQSRDGSLRQKRLVLKELHPTRHPCGTIPPETSPQHRLLQHPAPTGTPRGRFLPDTPSWPLPLPLNSFHLPQAGL